MEKTPKFRGIWSPNIQNPQPQTFVSPPLGNAQKSVTNDSEKQKLEEEKRLFEEQKRLFEQKQLEEQKKLEEQKRLFEQKQLEEQKN